MANILLDFLYWNLEQVHESVSLAWIISKFVKKKVIDTYSKLMDFSHLTCIYKSISEFKRDYNYRKEN